jgi:ABC-type branched-subunit amino acid transport system substrate-binding protein
VIGSEVKIWLLPLFVLPLCCWAAPIGGQLSPAEQRGKQIYESGVSPSKSPIIAVLGKERTETPASIVFCASCHGADGQGKPEGGVTPSDITWGALTKPYGVTQQNGRKHPPYTSLLLGRAITRGIDPAGNALDAAMPRYRLSAQDLADLVAYVRKVGSALDPGLTADSIRIGTLLPPGPGMADMSLAVRKVLTAYVESINSNGGIYNRRAEIRFAEQPEKPAERAQALRKFVQEQGLFALVSPYMAGAEEEMAAAARDMKAPLVGAFSLFPQIASPPNPYVFYLQAGLPGEGNALAGFAGKKYPAGGARAAIVYSQEPVSREAARAIREQCSNAGWKAIEEIGVAAGDFDSAAIAHKLADGGSSAIFLVVPGAAAKFVLQEGSGLPRNPVFFIPGSLATSDLFQAPQSLNDRLFLAFATLPSDQTALGLEEYRKLQERYQLPREHQAAQLTALASAKVLLEGLNVAGRGITRQTLIAALEGLYEFNTGLAPPLTYSPNRRIGSLGSHIVTVNLQSKRFIPIAEWVGQN